MLINADSILLGVASPITDHDVYLFKEGSHFKLHKKLGSHIVTIDGPHGRIDGVHFAVWAPNAERVSVIGDFNGWDGSRHALKVRDDWSGIWEGFIPGLKHGTLYKYRVESKYMGFKCDKTDPFAFYSEVPPKSASIVWSHSHEWSDDKWMADRGQRNSLKGPISIYEVHLGSWRRVPEDGDRFLNYRELAVYLADYAKEMGFTHVEFLPVMEHPFYGSWGYQTVGYFSPTSRYGTPDDFMFLVDHLHKNDIGVILDWVPSHFPGDGHGLAYFDGTHLFEHADPKKGFHPDWASYIFNYGRNEVRSFLISSALYWLEMFHADGIRVDAVASMLYLDYSRKEGEWIPNEYGGRENLDAISFLKRLNEAVYAEFPDVQMMAEESTDWPMVSRPTYLGGLGFGIKWNMGWMHDTLKYFSEDPLFRKYHHDSLTFSIWYAFSENFILPLSHDEVVHGKGSLIGKMPGDEWQRHANLRLLYGYMFGHPGKKLLFMGAEFAQVREWSHEDSLEWHVLKYDYHAGAQQWVKDLNRAYRSESALYEVDFDSSGFEWIDANNYTDSVITFIRKNRDASEIILVVCNLTPAVREDFITGVPRGGWWQEILNSDSSLYAGTNVGNSGGVTASGHKANHRAYSIRIKLPPLACVMFKWRG